MKSFTALGAVGLIAAAGVLLWFLSNPVVFTVKVKPLQPSSALPTFHRVPVPMNSPR